MKIHKKEITASSPEGRMNLLFKFAVDTLGRAWAYNDDTGLSLTFSDEIGAQGWAYRPDNSQIMISNGKEIVSNTPPNTINIQSDPFTGVVWEADGGSVGIGYVGNDGKYKTLYTLIKFNGTYNNHNVYGVTISTASGQGRIIVHGGTNIGAVNTCQTTGNNIGNGVYLHPIYDPVSGLMSSDVFGPQSIESRLYSVDGTVVKQGNNSYMAVLSGNVAEGSTSAVLFVKM